VRAVVVREPARAEIRAAFDWYIARSPRAARRFVDALVEAIAEIENSPERFPVVHGTLRRRLLSQFPYGVYYKVFPALISVVGVIHGRRHPEAWMQQDEP
jgi:plasmid stabilization system protein ParE